MVCRIVRRYIMLLHFFVTSIFFLGCRVIVYKLLFFFVHIRPTTHSDTQKGSARLKNFLLFMIITIHAFSILSKNAVVVRTHAQ